MIATHSTGLITRLHYLPPITLYLSSLRCLEFYLTLRFLLFFPFFFSPSSFPLSVSLSLSLLILSHSFLPTLFSPQILILIITSLPPKFLPILSPFPPPPPPFSPSFPPSPRLPDVCLPPHYFIVAMKSTSNKHFCCTICQRGFTRIDHLKRHHLRRMSPA